MKDVSGALLSMTFRKCLASKIALLTFVARITVLFFFSFVAPCVHAQNYLTSTGLPQPDLAEPAEMGWVDVSSGNLHLEIPLGSFPQRGGSKALVPKLVYDSHVWAYPTTGTNFYWTPKYNLYPEDFGSWGFVEGGAKSLVVPSYNGNNGCNRDFRLEDGTGNLRYFVLPGASTGGVCDGAGAYAIDGSGYYLYSPVCAGCGVFNTSGDTVYAPDGTLVFGPVGSTSMVDASKDSNGNSLSLTTAGSPPGISNPVIDTLGRTPVQPSTGTNVTYIKVPNAQGGLSQYTVNTATVPVKTAFGQSGITECNTNCTMEVITSIVLPDSSQYSFLYDCDSTTGNSACNSPGSQNAYYGTLTSMTLPSGQTITYGYLTWEDTQNNLSRWLTSKSSSGYWSYAPVGLVRGGGGYQGAQQVTVTRPDGSASTSIYYTLNGVWPIEIENYDTDGVTLLSTVKNTWNLTITCQLHECGGIGYQDTEKLATTTTVQVPGGSLTKQTTYSYDSPQTENVTAVNEWKYQSGTSPTFSTVPDKATYKTYATIGTNNNIDRPLTQVVCNNIGTDSDCPGGGSKVSKTVTTYDAYGSNGSLALQSVTGVVNHDDTNFGQSYTTRGNPTLISTWVSGTAYLTTALSYDTTGQVVKVVDSNGNPTTYSYTDAFFDDNDQNPPGGHSGAPTTNAYPTLVTDAIGSRSSGYYYGTGQVALSTDYNLLTTYEHYIDVFSRPTETDFPIGWALTTYGVPSGGQTVFDAYNAVEDTNSRGSSGCSSCIHSQTLADSLGRPSTRNLVNNPAGEVTVANIFDGLNRVSSSSHPHIGSSDPNNVYENTRYDGFGRVLGAIHPDGQITRVAYGSDVVALGGLASQQSSATTYGYGAPAVSVDEAGKQSQEWTDGFGRVIEVDEPSSNTATRGTATITVSGSEGSNQNCNPVTCICHTVWDTGTLTITVGDFSASAFWGKTSTSASLAATLASGLNSPQSPVTATVSGSTITMTAVGAGAYTVTFSTSITSQYVDFAFSPTSGNLSGGSGGLLSSPLVTTYTYDALGNLTQVVQGSQNRSWQYDGLSRLTQEITPEAGNTTSSYGLPGSLCSGNPSRPCSTKSPAPNQTGSATVTTTYSYNSANQLKQTTHSDTTGTETYTYGTSSSSFNVGRLITMTDPSGSEGYTYDQIGRVTQVQKTIGATVYTTGIAYSSGHEPTRITYPSGRAVYYNYDNVGHLCQVAASASSSCGATAPYVAIPSSSYDAAGRPLSATYGNGVVATAAYSPLSFKLTNLAYTKGTNTLLGLNYYYQYDSANCPGGNAIGNNGQIQCIADASSGTGDPGRSAAYTYDSLGRLFAAKTAGSTQYPAWGLSFTYDRYGNRTAQTVTAGSGYNSSLTVNPANNQITSPAFTYDAGGNVIAVPSPLSATYTYDGEECNTGYTGNGNTATYTCDGNNLRVKKVVTGTNAVTTVTIRLGGQVIAEYDNGAAVSSPTREYIYGNSLLATVTGSTGGSGGTIIYQHRDHLSPRLYTDVNGNDVGEQGAFPFGEAWYNNNTTSNWVFTSYERDAESGNDYALARSYSNNQGRFLAPDPLEGSVDDPQSWNRYAYVENDPIDLDDPSGQSFWKELGFGIAEVFATYFAPGIGNFLVTEFGVSQAVATAAVKAIQVGLAMAGGIGVIQNFQIPTGQGICPICSPGGGGGPPVFSDNGTTQGTQGLTLPDDPSKLPPEWVPDKSHKAPNGERRVRGDGTKIDFDRAQEGEPGWAGKDHWHVIRPGEKKPDRTLGDRGHIAPGTTVDLPIFAPKFSPVLPIPSGLVPTCPYCDGAYSPIRPPGVYPGMVPGGVTPDVPVPSIPPFMPTPEFVPI